MERTFIGSKEDVITALDAGCRVYYVERGKDDIYEYTPDQAFTELRDAEFYIFVKK